MALVSSEGAPTGLLMTELQHAESMILSTVP
jgi:hypothetical protein